MRLLDLFCGAGGAAMGYHRAGFTEIVGVDLRPQPRYPFDFVQADALTFPLEGFDAIHASPPCQFASVATPMAYRPLHPNLIPAIRARLQDAGVPAVIENVPNARRHLQEPMVMLCGSMFGLQVWRHRYFEGVHFIPPAAPYTCNHITTDLVTAPPGSNARKARANRAPVLVTGTTRRKDGGRFEFSTEEKRQAMQIDWMVKTELDEAIPPAYTEFIGRRLLEAL